MLFSSPFRNLKIAGQLVLPVPLLMSGGEGRAFCGAVNAVAPRAQLLRGEPLHGGAWRLTDCLLPFH